MANRYKELDNTEKNIVDQLINCIASCNIDSLKLIPSISKAKDKIRLTKISTKFKNFEELYLG